jgi:hypothetical protein
MKDEFEGGEHIPVKGTAHKKPDERRKPIVGQ